MMKWLRVAIALSIVGCSSGETHSATGVAFRIQSPFCGPNLYSFRFSIDSVVVGTDSLRDGQTSAQFATTPGQHRLDARVTAAPFAMFAFDTIVTVPADTVFVQVVDLYCS